jgi:hypothetical protein
MMSRLRRIPLLALTPILATLTLMAWVFASPIGAGPDDDFHLVSAWCAGPTADETCIGNTTTDTYSVPVALVEIACFKFEPTQSAACQGEDWSWSAEERVETYRANFAGSYPPVFYAVTGALSGGDIQTSALAMRTLTVLLFVGITVALYLLLPSHRRPTLLWTWLLTSVPLGLFLFGTNNPSVWAWIGVGSTWIALLGYYETEGRRKAALGALFVVTALMGAGSRSDAALFTGLAIALVMLLTVVRKRRYFVESILPVAMGLVALVMFLGAYFARLDGAGFIQEPVDDPIRRLIPDSATGSVSDPAAISGTAIAQPALEGFGLFASNLLNVTELWTGALGGWALGWLDTSMPAFVPAATVAAFVLVGAAGLARVTGRKAWAIAVVAAVLVVLPVFVLQAGGNAVGEQFQPRYLLPLIALLAGLLLLTSRTRPVALTLIQRIAVIIALSSAQFVALHLNIRRYVTGIDQSGPNLDEGLEWWWVGPVGPNAVWLLGSLAYALLVTILINRLAKWQPTNGSEPDRPGDTSESAQTPARRR